MKTKKFSIGIIFLALTVCTTCTKDEVVLTPVGDSSTLKAAAVEDAVFIVTPNGIDDTQTIRDAFEDAKAAGPGSIVYLTEGVFKIKDPIEIVDFNGSFVGAGRNLTEIVIEELYESILNIKGIFVDYSIHISDITFRYNEIITPGASVIRYYEGPALSTTHIQNVNIVGVKGQGVHENWAIGILIDPVTKIKIDAIIEGCIFIDAGEAIKIIRDYNSLITIKENQFIDLENGIVHFDTMGSIINISRNKFDFNVSKHWYVTAGIILFGGIEGYESQYLIAHNDFQIDYLPTIWLWDVAYQEAGIGTMRVEIKSNSFVLSDMNWDGILVLFSKNTLISNNKFTGNAWSAVSAILAENLVILGDNINNLSCTVFEYSKDLFGSFPIQLYEWTGNSVVIGNAKDNVLDYGTNNVLTGVTPYAQSPGSSINDIMNNRIQKILAQYNVSE